ncbi:MFS transporter [Aequorivita sp. H23M31]|uniref:MFS transporter n=1 Tax=Aequorivita ciconiae TaxID=2494375 RepID=A0A410G1H6_9FLAO|nr:MFS transporter [Aequorivita sp. H23M31]QAA81095.1 MFS transporter [Aequorivita sp. H23M31]
MEEKFKTLKFIHGSICGGLFLIYILFGTISMEMFNFPSIGSSSSAWLFIPVAAFALGNILFQSQLKKIDKNDGLEENFRIYQTASIIRWSILEGAALLLLFIAPEFIVFGFCIIIYMAYLRPSENKMNTDLQKIKY